LLWVFSDFVGSDFCLKKNMSCGSEDAQISEWL